MSRHIKYLAAMLAVAMLSMIFGACANTPDDTSKEISNISDISDISEMSETSKTTATTMFISR